MTQINDAHRKKLLAELAEHQAVQEGDTNLVAGLQDLMEEDYQRMRKKAGIEEALENSDGSDYETE
jgi:hypothetical protein